MTLLAPVPAWMLLIWKLVGGNDVVAVVPAARGEFGQRRQRLVDRVARLFRIRDVALHAVAPSMSPTACRAGRRASGRPAVAFDDGSPVMHQSMRWLARAEDLGDLAHAVDGIAFLVRCQQQARPCRDAPDAPRRSVPARPRRPRRCPSCRPRRGRTDGRRALRARTDRCSTHRAGPAAPRRCGRATPAPVARCRASPTGCRRRRNAGARTGIRRAADARRSAPGSRRRPA